MAERLQAAFLDFATLGPNMDRGGLDALLDVTYFDSSDPAQVRARVRNCDVVIVNKAHLGREAIAAAPRLKLVALTGTGTDNVDLAAATERGIAVSNTRGYCTAALTQHVFALILALTQQINGYDALVRAGAWQRSGTFALFDFPIRELAGRVLGIVGYGTLGRAVGRLGEALGMRLMVAARIGTPRGEVPNGRYTFDAVLERADVLTLHCPLTTATRHLIGAQELARMPRDALLINTARGGLIDSEALAAALRSRQIGGAGIDVLPEEPPAADHPLLAAGVPNLIVTPHIAWTAQEARQRALDQVAENVREFIAGRSLRRVI